MSRNKPILIWSINLQQRRQDYTMGKRDTSINGAEKTLQLDAKDLNWTIFSQHIQKLKID